MSYSTPADLDRDKDFRIPKSPRDRIRINLASVCGGDIEEVCSYCCFHCYNDEKRKEKQKKLLQLDLRELRDT